MKALIIENEYDVDSSIRAFLKDNPSLFESVNEQTFCKHREMMDLARFIHEADAIIIATTWMYKDQVIEYKVSIIILSSRYNDDTVDERICKW